MAGLKVLITSFMCVQRTGLEVYVRDLALGLQQRGHVPIIYSPLLGELAQKLRSKTIPVVDDLNAVGTFPDIIHGHHHMETMTALLHFPGVPAIYFCHNSFSPLDSPPPSPRVLRFVAVDQPCYEKLVFEHGVPAERARLLLNFVDGARFAPRTALPSRPQRALLYGNYATEDANLAAVREACSRAGLQLDVVGLGVGNNVTEPEQLLGQYDIVFAKSRAAAEALTVGTAVVIYCMRSVGPMVTASELERLLPLNFGIRAMKSHWSPESLTEALSQEIARYDAQDAAEVSSRVRNLLQSDKAIDEILSLYDEVISEHRNAATSDALAEGRAAAEYIRWLSGRVSQHLGVVIDSPVVQPEEPAVPAPLVADGESTRIDGTTPFHIDKFGPVTDPADRDTMRLTAGEDVLVSGWALDPPRNQPAAAIELLVNGRVYRAAVRVPRGDVARAFGSHDYFRSGFAATFPAAAFEPSPSDVEVRILVEGGRSHIPALRLRVELA